MAVAAEQLEQIVGTVKTIFLSSMAAVLGVERFAAAACDEHVGFLAGRGVHDLGDIGTRTVGAIDARLQNLDIGTFKRRRDTRQRRSQGSLAANDGDLGRSRTLPVRRAARQSSPRRRCSRSFQSCA